MKVRFLSGEELNFPTATSGGVENHASGAMQVILRDAQSVAIAFFRYEIIAGYWLDGEPAADAKPPVTPVAAPEEPTPTLKLQSEPAPERQSIVRSKRTGRRASE